MAKQIEEKVVLSASTGDHHPGSFYWREFDQGERWKRAGKAAGICIIIGAATLPIPIVHFVVPAAMAIAAPIAGYLQFRKQRVADNVVGVCPSCENEVTVTLDGDDRVPLRKYCPSCDKPLEILETPQR